MLNTLNVASSGLAVAREQVENVMNNIANENTPGYKKRVVDVSEARHIDERNTGRGALIDGVSRTTNTYMYDNLTTEKGKQSEYEEFSLMLSDIEAIFYETEDSGFSADLDRYFQAVENLRASPSNEIYKNDLQTTGTAIVDDLQTLYSDIEHREITTKKTLETDIQEVNATLVNIGRVNNLFSNSTEITNDLLDKRDNLEQELTKYVDVNVEREIGYELQVNGLAAVRYDDNVHEMSLSSTTVTQQDNYGYYDTNTESVKSALVNQTTWVDSGDKLTYKFDNTTSISVTYGEVITYKNSSGVDVNVDLNGDGDLNNDAITKENIVQALVYKINNTAAISNKVTAYNGEYSLDTDGAKILKSPQTTDHHLIIESNISGDVGKFVGRIIVEDNGTATELSKDKDLSVKGIDDVSVQIFGRDIDPTSGKLKPLVNNLDTDSSTNLFSGYKEKLDALAMSLSDMYNSFIEKDDGTYISGVLAVDVASSDDRAKRVETGLFSGSTVKTLTFNEGVVGSLTQEKLDYMATLQWNTDIDIDGTGENNTSFSSYNQAFRVEIAKDKETIDFKKDTQTAVTQSLQNAYDKITKVDKDEEMMNLIKFQSAYEANAKLITIIDEMLATILGMRR